MRFDSRWVGDPSSTCELALSYHDFLNADTIGAAVAAGEWRVGGPTERGLTTNLVNPSKPADLVSDYRIAALWTKAGFRADTEWPIELECEYARNLGARGAGRSARDALLAGVTVGRRGDPGDLQFGLEHVIVEQDAVLAAVNRGKYATNYEGTELEARYCPYDGVEWRVAYTLSHNLRDLTPGFAFDERELRLYVSYDW
jgi:hypothetical protein